MPPGFACRVPTDSGIETNYPDFAGMQFQSLG